MNFKNTQALYVLKNVCIWSLLCDLTLVLFILIGYILTILIGFIKGSSFVQGVGWLLIVFPATFIKIISLLIIAAANGYFIFFIYLEQKKNKKNLPLSIVNATNNIFNKIIKNNVINKFIIFVSAISYLLNTLFSIACFYPACVGIITFLVLYVIHKIKKYN